MGRQLRSTVVIGEKSYLAGSEPPADVAKLITNPDAWDGEPEPVKAPRRRAARSGGGSGGQSSEEPPRGGEGSGVEEWRAHAEKLDIEVPEDATRDDIVALVDAHNSGE